MVFSDTLAVLGGADAKTLEEVPSVRGQFVQLGLVLISTAGLAGVSMWFALTDGVKIGAFAALPAALIWALVIFNLDRFLTTNMRSTTSGRRALAMAVPRFLMAALIGLVVSTPLVLRVFETDIKAEMERHSAAESARNAERVANSSEQQTVTKLTAAVAQLKKEQGGGVTLPVTAEETRARTRVSGLEGQAANQRTISADAQKLYICERYGEGRAQLKDPNRCSPKPGVNGPYQQIEADAKRQETILENLESQLVTARQDLQTTLAGVSRSQADARRTAIEEATAKLPAAEKRLADATTALTAFQGSLDGSNLTDRGILAQLRGLDLLGQQNSTMHAAHLAIAGIFFMIEVLPVLVKLLMNWNAPSLYDRIRDNADEAVFDAAKADRAERRRSLTEDTKMQREVDDDMRVREKSLGINANTFVASRMEKILEKALDQWDQQVQQMMTSSNATASGSPQPNGSGPQSGGGQGQHSAAGSASTGSTGPGQAGSTAPAGRPPGSRIAARLGAIRTAFNLPSGGRLP